MARSNAAHVVEGDTQKHYRINPKVKVTRRSAGDKGSVDTFFKHSDTGRLYRFGKEEHHLLTELDRDLSFDAVAESFAVAFGKTVRPQVVEDFAEQMVKAKVLVVAEDAREVAGNDAPDAPQKAAPAEAPTPEAESAPGDATPEDSITGEIDEDTPTPPHNDRDDDVFGGLEDEVFGDTPEPPQEDAEARAAREEAARHADPRLAKRNMRFKSKAAPKDPTSRGMLRLFDPTAMLRALIWMTSWWRPIRWMLYPMVLFAVLAVLHRLTELGLAMMVGRGAFNIFGTLTISFVTVNLISRLATGMAIIRNGGEVRSFGLKFILFVVPRFAIDETSVMRMEREAKLAVYAATLRSRLMLFAWATIIWAATRQSSTLISDIAVIVEQIALFSFLLTALPLLKGDGYKWISTYFNQPLLRQRSYAYLFGVSAKGVKLPTPSKGEKWAYSIFAIGSILFMGLMVVLGVMYLSTALEGRFGGAGVIMFFGIIGLILVWMTVMKAGQKEAQKDMMKAMIAEKLSKKRGGKRAKSTGNTLPVAAPGHALKAQSRALDDRVAPRSKPLPLKAVYSYNAHQARRARWMTRMAVVAGLSVLIYAAFLPYHYEVGGDFSILPDARIEVTARVPGELTEILVDEGDVVEKGQLLARISDRQMTYQVNTTRAQLDKAKAQLQRLLDGASAEEIQLAQQQVAGVEADLPFLKAQADRAVTLLERKAISDAEAERYQSAYVAKQQDLKTAQANLANVEAKATDSEVAILQAEVDRLNADLAYKLGLLGQVEIRATAAGRIVTENVQFKLGQYLDVGDVFAEIEDHKVARAEVKVSEADIGLVNIGDRVRLKAWSTADAERDGTVVAIAPLAEEEEFGRVVRVKTQFPNENGFFRPGMTGFAKIDGAQMDTWQAFTRLFDRFFRIEVWGWIP